MRILPPGAGHDAAVLLQISYDLLLLRQFRDIRPPEEQDGPRRDSSER